MKSKKPDLSIKIPKTFDTSSHKTERTAVAILMHWMRNIIEEKNIDLGAPDVETAGTDRKMPDTVIYESRRSQQVLCLIEAKPPYYDVFDVDELKEPARKKATQRRAKYFCVTNLKTLVWYKTEDVNAQKPEEEQIKQKYTLSDLEDMNDIEQTRYSASIKRELSTFLLKLYSVHSGQEAEPRLPVDEFLIFRLQEKIKVLAGYYKTIIDDQVHKNDPFRAKLKKWFSDQGWSFGWHPSDYEKASRQAAYLLINKILFYDILQAKRPHDLDPLEIPEGLTKSAMLENTLQGYFTQALKIDYETVFTTDFIDSVAFINSEEVVKEIKSLVAILRRYDFSTLGFDVIGRIFERLIPQGERHTLGQYFTSPDVVDLILTFCLKHENDKVLDPSCGAGTFLVRSYQHKKIMNQRKEHTDILDTLWGNDIAKFPAHLATINLAINDLSVDKNYPNIIKEDFFNLLVGGEGFDPDKWRKARAKTLGVEEREITYPRWFDAIVGNPPYTRQEEMGEIAPEDEDYKDDLIKKAVHLGKRKIAEIGKRAGIFAYFFPHGTKFLKENGFLGFVVQNYWLDTDYGKGLQEFFLKNHKIIAIIESKVERWFEEADVNTCIIILQKCASKKERDENLVRFVYLKKKLSDFIPPAEDIWGKQVERLSEIKKLQRTILAHNDLYENDELRIFPKPQKELWEEGYDNEKKKYAYGNWGKYLRAPDIYFTVMNKGKSAMAPMKQFAKIFSGMKTGANNYFYLSEKEINSKGIEKEYWMNRDRKGSWHPNFLAESLSDIDKYLVEPDQLKKRVVVIHTPKRDLKDSRVASYILEGERQNLHTAKTCNQNAKAKDGRWYDLTEKKANLMWPEYSWTRLAACYSRTPVYINNRLYSILPDKPELMAGILNSTLVQFIAQVTGPGAGGGAKGIRVQDLKAMPIPFINVHKYETRIKKAFSKLLSRNIETIFIELGADRVEEVTLENIMPDRRELDRIIMGDILGLTDTEQLEVYRALIDLVKSRVAKAKSVGKKKKTAGGLDVDALKEVVVKRIDGFGE
jgi:type I restriction-modification system DNA methylase subunit